MRQDVGMSVLRDIGKIIRVTALGTRTVARGVRATASGTTRASRWVRRGVGVVRKRGGAGNVGMMRLLDLHAVSCAGDTLVTIGLAGTIFFSVPAGEARGRVALYLLVTMVPFALLAPVVGPMLDRFRHGRRYALAATMLGRALLAWVIADNLLGFGLYPAAFGVLALSRAYGVARSAAVPRLLPRGLGLSQAGARASVYGTVAGAIVAPLGAAAFSLGPQWPLRVASVLFLVGVIVALALPPKADSDPPEIVPKIFQVPWRQRVENGDKILSGRLVVAALIGSACMRSFYGFLLLFLAFTIREQDLPQVFAGVDLGDAAALSLVGGALVLGTFSSTAIGTGLSIRRPARLQAIWFCIVAVAGVWAAVRLTLPAVVLLCLATAVASGLAKLAVDAAIQERIPDTVRASAFAHAETLLMLAWVAGGALGLIRLSGHVGVGLAALAMVAAATRGAIVAWRLRTDVLRGRAARGGAGPDQGVADSSAHEHHRAHPPRQVPATPVTPTPVSAAAPAGPHPAGPHPAGPHPAGPHPAGPHPATGSTPTVDTAGPIPGQPSSPPDDEPPPGYHIYRPSPPGDGLPDPRSGA
jgi:hypothetical protein